MVKVLWKIVNRLLNQRLNAAIKFHYVTHRFWEGHGMENATLEANLIQQLMAMREAFLFEILLDTQKAYDALDWEI